MGGEFTGIKKGAVAPFVISKLEENLLNPVLGFHSPE
jgi:hypothetical protein